MYKLKESTEIILVIDSYTHELKYPLKEQERSDRAGLTAPLQTYIGEISQKMSQGKNYQKFLSNTKNKSHLLKKFTRYLTIENTRKNLMDRTTFNIEKNTVLISQSQQRNLFTSNQEEADSRIALHCSESSKPRFGKSKG